MKKGDSLWKICKNTLKERNGGKEPSAKDVLKMVHEIAKLNKMNLTDVILPGQKLKVPAGDKAPAKPEPVPPVPERKPGKQPEKQPVKEPGKEPEKEPEPSRPERQSSTDLLRSRFGEIDQDGNKHVSEKEIQQYIKQNEKSLSQEQRKGLEELAKNVGRIEELANDEKGDENSGISREDLDKLDQVRKQSEKVLRSNIFQQLDRDGNKFLSNSEITQALTRGRLSPEQRLTLEFLKDNMKLLEEGTNNEHGDENSGISMNDLRYYANLGR